MAEENEELKNKLEAAEENIAMAKGDVQGSSPGTKRKVSKRESSSGSAGGAKSKGSPEV